MGGMVALTGGITSVCMRFPPSSPGAEFKALHTSEPCDPSLDEDAASEDPESEGGSPSWPPDSSTDSLTSSTGVCDDILECFT